MDTSLKVTDQPEEIAFDDIVAGDQIINIPLFQRAYKWSEKNISDFWDDIESIIDGSSRSHFLGVLVLVPQARRVGSPVVLDIVDGQQRLSTCYLSILAIVQAAVELGHADWAVEVVKGYLLTRRFSNYSTNTKLIPSAVDRQQFQIIWTRLTNLKGMENADWRGDTPSPPQSSGSDTGRMLSAYLNLVKRSREVSKNSGFEGLQKFFEILVGKLSFVTINLRSPTAAPAIFERLNARGEKINISDLVRNEIFSRVADDPAKAKGIFETYWEPFVNSFSENSVDFEKILFPYGLTINSNTTKADLFQTLRQHWGDNLDPRGIINSISKYVPCLFVLENGHLSSFEYKNFGKGLAKLNSLGAPTSCYPFVFQLYSSISSGQTREEVGVEVLGLLESFFVRRAICGYEPTGLHAVFKGLWSEISPDTVNVTSVIQKISRRNTVPWPGDDEFRNGILNGDLYRRKVAKFILGQFELDTDSESPVDDFEIEHIFPINPHKDWDYVVSDKNDSIINSWGNLIPISREMNPSVSNNVYSEKREKYRKSKFSTTRLIAEKNEEWNLEVIQKRNIELAEWALKRWPYYKGSV